MCGRRSIEYPSSSEILARQVHSLLIRFGIVSSIRFVQKSNQSSQKFNACVISIASEEYIENLFKKLDG